MPYSHHISYNDGTQVHVWALAECEEQLVELCRQQGLAVDDVPTVRSHRRRAELLAERLLLCHALGKTARLRHHENGAPYVEGIGPLHVSISHTAGLVCVACNPTHRVGVDVEQLSDRVLRVRERYLHPEEQAFLSPDDVTSHLIAWTAKEALYKIDSRPATNFVTDVRLDSIALGSAATSGMLRATCYGVPCIVSVTVTPTHVMSLAIHASSNSQLVQENFLQLNNIKQ